MRSLELHLHILLMGFKELIAYRVTIVMLVFSIPIVLFARYYMLAALYADGRETVDGYSLQGVLTYLVCAWLLRSFFRTGVDRRLGRMVRSGDVVFDLMRPINFVSLTFFRATGKSLNRFLFISGPLIIVFLATDVLIFPTDVLRWLVFAVMVLLGYVIAFELQFIVGLLAFYIGYNLSLIWTFDLVIQVLAGLLLPLHFFPDSLERLVMMLPFRHIYYTPTQVFMGHLAVDECFPVMFSSLLWVLGLGLLSYGLYRSGVRRLVIAGG